MQFHVPPLNEVTVPATVLEVDIFMCAVQSFLLGEQDTRLHSLLREDVKWQHLWLLAAANKLSIPLLRGLNTSAAEPLPEEFASAMRSTQEFIDVVNSRCLHTALAIADALQSEKIRALVFKGPLQQLRVYRDSYIRPSSDLDILVNDEAFIEAGRVLERNGFHLMEECDSLWWRVFLGEQHFASEDKSLSIIDLHRRIQQPGCPSPHRMEPFVRMQETVRVGEADLSVVSDESSFLISCMSLAKALIHREAAGHHVCDIAASIRYGRVSDLDAVLHEAREQRLLNTVLLGLRAASVLFRLPIDRTYDESVPGWMSNHDFASLILMPWACDHCRPRRLRLLYELADNKAVDFMKEAVWTIGAELGRRCLHEPLLRRRKSQRVTVTPH
jgi:hypothetical protein